MPTIVDSLVVTLSLDPTKFKAGQAETETALKRTRTEAQRTAKDLQEHGKQAAMFFSSIKNEFLGLIGVLAGSAGVGLALKNASDGLVKLQFAATNIGIDPGRLQAIDRALNRNGASADAASTALQNYAQQAQLAKLGQNPGFIGALAPIGGNINDSGEQFLLKAQQYVADHLNNPRLIQTVLGRLGLGQDTINSLIRIGSVGKLNEEIAYSLREIGTASKGQIEAADKFQHGVRDFQQSIDQLQTVMVGLFGGPLGDFLEWLAKRHPEFADAPHNTLHPPPHGPVVVPGGWWDTHMPPWLGGSAGGTPPVANPSFAGPNATFLQRLSAPESGGSYGAIGGSKETLPDLSRFPSGPGHFGRYQFDAATWADEARKNGLADFSPASQDWAAFDLAATTYYQATHRQLTADLAAGGHDQEIARALAGRWPSVAGGAQSRAPLAAANFGAPAPSGARPSVAAALGALTPAPAARAAAAPYAPGGFPGGPDSNGAGGAATTITNHFGPVTVNTAATDAKGIARDLTAELVTQANRGQW